MEKNCGFKRKYMKKVIQDDDDKEVEAYNTQLLTFSNINMFPIDKIR